MFGGELRIAVQQASADGVFERALLTDIRRAHPAVSLQAEGRLAGLVAQVNLHGRWHEGHKSAADLGVVIRRPSIIQASTTKLRIIFNQAYGLLGQAKLGKTTAKKGLKWGRLTEPQKALIPKRLSYYSLILYRLTGERREELEPFTWQLCKEHSVDEIEGWLRSGEFPDELASEEIIERLAAGRCGTADRATIESRINPENSRQRAVEIRVDWPDDDKPPGFIATKNRQQKSRVPLLQRH